MAVSDVLVAQPKTTFEHLDFAPDPPLDSGSEAHTPWRHRARALWLGGTCAAVLLVGGLGFAWLHRETAQDLFWKPVLDTPGPVLVAIGDVPNGPPTPAQEDGSGDTSTPILAPNPSHTLPFADAVTMARVVGALESNGKKVVIRNENSRTFSDLREGPVVSLAHSTTNGASVSPTSCATAWPSMRTSTLSIYGTPKIRHREPGVGAPISHATIWAEPTVRCCRTSP